jgi:hypothetical protein
MLHILNGGALLDRFPDEIEGVRIACHECLIEGPVQAENLKEFGKVRSQFLQNTYNASFEEYYSKMVAPFDVLGTISPQVEIYLWFEEDLFCQANMWFMIRLLMHYEIQNSVFLVLPHTSLTYGFAGLDHAGLIEALQKKKEITKKDLSQFDALWRAYSNSDSIVMKKVGESLSENFSFVLPAITAHFQRQEIGDSIGLPKKTLVAIARELKTVEFSKVFREFSRRLPIYGFGDLQVKGLWEEVLTAELL